MNKHPGHHPDKTPVFGIDELESEPATISEDDSTDPKASKSRRKTAIQITLRDSLSGARLTSDQASVEIGNGRRFDLALRGPGPDGLYARLEKDPATGVCVIEKVPEGLFMAVDNVEATQATLSGQTTIQLGDHTLQFSIAERDGAETRPGRPRKWIALAVVLGLGVSALGLQFLLSADKADTRVSVVTSDRNPDDTETSPDNSAMATAPESAVSAPEAPEPEVTQADSSLTPGVETDSQPETGQAEEPTTQDDQATAESPERPSEPAEVSATETKAEPSANTVAAEPENAGDQLEVAVARYQQGLEVAPEQGPPSLVRALAAIDKFKAAGSIDQMMAAWNELKAAEAELGVSDADSAHRDRLQAALSTELRTAAEKAGNLGKRQTAYRYYARAADLGAQIPRGQTLMATMDSEAERLFRFGYRLQYSDPATAGEYWAEILDAVPPQSPWHRKATLALNSTTGADYE